MSKKILITTSSFDVASSPALAQLAAAGFEIVLNPFGRRLNEAEAAQLLADKNVVGMIAGVEPLTRAVLSGATGLRVISRCGIGMDSVDLESAREQNIVVRNTPAAPSMAVAELTLGLMLDMLRRVSQADRGIRAGAWKQIMGNLLASQVVGIVGYGGIGKRVAALVRAFGAQVLVFDTRPIACADGIKAVSFDEIIAQADVISLHVPYMKENYHLLNAATFARMKTGAMIVNAARGGLIDEEALRTALETGQIAAAALDCFEQEPYDGALTKLPQVLLTAHMGSYAKESRLLMEQEAAENLLQGLQAQGLMA